MARIFAVLWILLGITLFNMLTAQITSELTTELSQEGDNTIFNKKVGVEKDLNAPYSGVAKVNAKPIVYDNLTSLKKGLFANEVRAIALESFMAGYYLNDLKAMSPDIGILLTVDIDMGTMGMLSSQKLVNLIKSFLDHNKDSTDMIISNSYSKLKNLQVLNEKQSKDKVHFSAKDHNFYIIIVITAVLAIGCFICGKGITMIKKRNDAKQTDESPDGS